MAIHIRPMQSSQHLYLYRAEAPDQVFAYTLPEATASTAATFYANAPDARMNPQWEILGEQHCRYAWTREGLLTFKVDVRAFEAHLDVAMELTNLTAEPWKETFAFNCLSPSFETAEGGGAYKIADFDGGRTRVLCEDGWHALTTMPRKHSDRPTIQLWYVTGQQKPVQFVEHFGATCPVATRGAIAIESLDGRVLVAATSRNPLFLFSNLEFACIHCSPQFGALAPGETGHGDNRVFFTQDLDLEDLRAEIEAYGSEPGQKLSQAILSKESGK